MFGERPPGGEQESARRAFEVCERLSGVAPLNPERDAPLHDAFLDRYFAGGLHPDEGHYYRNGFGYRLQATRGTPLRYLDGENLIDLGFGRDGLDAVAVGPMGQNAAEITASIAEELVPAGIRLAVKKVSEDEAERYRELGFVDVDYAQDFSPSNLPDDVYPEVSIDLRKYDELRNVGPKNSYLRQRFNKFLTLDSSLSLGGRFGELPLGRVFVDESPGLVARLESFVERWADRKAALVGGEAREYVESYLPILRNLNSLGKGFVEWKALEGGAGDVVSLFVATRLSRHSYGAVVNLVDTDYRGLAEAAVIEATDTAKSLFDTWRAEDDALEYLNLGGSEIQSLHDFKRKFVPNREVRMRYLRYARD